LSGILQDGLLGDQEIAVGIRSNSHYRISARVLSRQVGMLIGLRKVKDSWAHGEHFEKQSGGSFAVFWHGSGRFLKVPPEGYFYFYPFEKRKDEKIMKKTLKSALALLLLCTLTLTFFSCKEERDLWKDALYLEDTTLGEGERTAVLEVTALERKVTFTVKTDKEMLGEALLEIGLIEGDMDTYGLYVKKVNGMRADYEKDGRYWALYIDGEYGLSGVDSVKIEEGVVYRFDYAK
jgi:hypothetical protein